VAGHVTPTHHLSTYRPRNVTLTTSTMSTSKFASEYRLRQQHCVVKLLWFRGITCARLQPALIVPDAGSWQVREPRAIESRIGKWRAAGIFRPITIGAHRVRLLSLQPYFLYQHRDLIQGSTSRGILYPRNTSSYSAPLNRRLCAILTGVSSWPRQPSHAKISVALSKWDQTPKWP
jgi:hypothetical protein